MKSMYMMKAILVLMALFCLQISAVADPESISTGPYNISFDLGMPKGSYELNVSPPKETESLGGAVYKTYAFEVRDRNNSEYKIYTSITKYSEKQISMPYSAKNMETIMKNIVGGIMSEIDTRQVDGKNAAIARYAGTNGDTYTVMYYQDEYTLVLILSGYPWDDATLAFIKSFHVSEQN